jgi:agmatinase
MKIWRDLKVSKIEDANVIIASVSSDRAASVGKGARKAPKRIRKLSWFLPPYTKEGISIKNLKVFDSGDIGRQYTAHHIIEKRAEELFEHEKFNLFLGGDHAISIPLEKAFLEYCKKNKKTPAIIHIDAHPDFCDIYQNSKTSHACTNARAVDNGYNYKDIVLLGIRGFEEEEISLLSNQPEITIVRADQLKDYDFSIFKKKFDDNYAIYLSLDIDVIDPSFCPGTGTPETYGVSPEEITKIINTLIFNLPIKAMDIVEVSPPLDINNITSWTAVKILYEIFATLIRKLEIHK